LDLKALTVQKGEICFPQRLGDAQCCLTGGSSGGALYLCGYAVEMALKLAAFRLTSCRSDDLVKALVDAVKSKAQPPGRRWRRLVRLGRWSLGTQDNRALPATPFTAKFASGHSLVFWEEYYRVVRRGSALDPVLDTTLATNVSWLSSVWAVEMRYSDLAGITPATANDALERAKWFVSAYNDLKRR
jgi:hypothetical protein